MNEVSSLEQLGVLLSEMPQPRSYYIGRGGAPTDSLPGNVICFPRLSAGSLGGSGAKMIHYRSVFIMSLKGEGTVCIDAANFRLRPGVAVIVQPYQYHSYTDLEESLQWLFITFEAMQGRWQELANGTHSLGELEQHLVREVMECWRSKKHDSLLPWHLGLLLERMDVLPQRHLQESEAPPDLLVRVNQYALEHLDRIVPLPELAKVIGLSESHLRAEFRQLTGQALGWHLRYLRHQRACALLDTTDKSISEIALACGFDSLYSFSRAFKTFSNLSPSQYRRRG